MATCIWKMSPRLIVALDERLGSPVDAYVNGSQVWLRDDGPGGATVEWRLHPVAGYRPPEGLGTYDVFEEVAASLAVGTAPASDVGELWEGLEAFPAHGDEVEPAILAAACSGVLGLPPDAAGLVDHGPVGDAWERARGRYSIVGALLDQLSG